MKTFLFIVCFGLTMLSTNGGLRRTPTPHAITSANGQYVFTIVPKPGEDFQSFGGAGICYKVDKNGGLNLLWRASGWYSENLFLSYDGKSLVRIGSWQSYDQDHGPIEETLAIAFYREGKLVKRYTISDLVKDLKSLLPTTAGTLWLSGKGEFLTETDSFSLETSDKIFYTFSLKTGEITNSEQRKSGKD